MVLRPSLMKRQAPLRIKLCDLQILFLVQESLAFVFTVRKDSWPRYLELRTCKQSELLNNRHHPHLSRRAQFMSLVLRSPRPPIDFGEHKEPQDLRHNLVWPLEFDPHQNLQSIESIVSLIVLGRTVDCMA
ncbi:hypothetical protein PanWU01x14_297570 [Parasponia andersonii]|uniref:Uncharacterized protein n=1 Tax=Parasponia andersonii TaxID=3476 RepID=A0A2P5AV46_PARAD|nr:hypothetical protein PanWU01x14_297570 [Parasponia andersonii]